jgi:endonuclease YncB( thermonuclease family)
MKPVRRQYKTGLLLPVLLLLGLCDARAAEEHFVKRVYSGNYIKLQARTSGEKDIKVRYIGVDAPDKGKPFFELCRKANKELVEKKMVTLQTDTGAAETQGKLLGYVFAGDVFVNAELIKNGAALVAAPDGNQKHRGLFLSLQQQARKARSGLWAFEDQSDEPYYVGSKSKKVFHRPTCFHIKGLDFEDRLIFRTKGEALAGGYSQDWRCCPLFTKVKQSSPPAAPQPEQPGKSAAVPSP